MRTPTPNARLYLDARSGDWDSAAERLLASAPYASDISTADFEGEVADELEDLGYRSYRHPGVAGVKPDFLVETPKGRRVVIEVKVRDNPSLVEAIQARTQATRLAEATDADTA